MIEIGEETLLQKRWLCLFLQMLFILPLSLHSTDSDLFSNIPKELHVKLSTYLSGNDILTLTGINTKLRENLAGEVAKRVYKLKTGRLEHVTAEDITSVFEVREATKDYRISCVFKEVAINGDFYKVFERLKKENEYQAAISKLLNSSTLQKIYLWRAHLTDEAIPETLSETIKCLNLSGNSLHNASLRKLLKQPHLLSLSMAATHCLPRGDENPVSDDDIPQDSKLQELYLHHITEKEKSKDTEEQDYLATLGFFKKLTSLKRFTLPWTRGHSSSTLRGAVHSDVKTFIETHLFPGNHVAPAEPKRVLRVLSPVKKLNKRNATSSPVYTAQYSLMLVPQGDVKKSLQSNQGLYTLSNELQKNSAYANYKAQLFFNPVGVSSAKKIWEGLKDNPPADPSSKGNSNQVRLLKDQWVMGWNTPGLVMLICDGDTVINCYTIALDPKDVLPLESPLNIHLKGMKKFVAPRAYSTIPNISIASGDGKPILFKLIPFPYH